MILVNIARSGRNAVTDEQVERAAAGDWSKVTDAALDAYADSLLAVQRNVVRGAYKVRGWNRTDEGKVRFQLESTDELAHWIGQQSPVRWRRGQARPVAYYEDDGDGPPVVERAVGKPRRGVHRLVIETKGQSDSEAANLHHSLLTVAKASGRLHGYRSTLLVREIQQAKTDLDYHYGSRPSPPRLP